MEHEFIIPKEFIEIPNNSKTNEQLKEEQRHQAVLDKINEANTKGDLPKVTLSVLLRYLSDNAYFERKLDTSTFEPVYELIVEKGSFLSPVVKAKFIEILKSNYPAHLESEYEEKYNKINPTKVGNLIEEIYQRHTKIEEIEKRDIEKNHNSIMRRINDAYELSDLPLVSKGTLNSHICASSRCYPSYFRVADIEDISDDLIEGKSIDSQEIINELRTRIEEKNPGFDDHDFAEFYSRLTYGNKLNFIVEEVNARNKRMKEIYSENHDETMENIKNARRISQLPPNMSVSTLTGYLSGNTIIYPKANPISSTKMLEIVKLILEGKTFEDDEVQYELKKLAANEYPDKARDAYERLYLKLSALPKTYYLRDEINYVAERQKEFIGRGGSNVNVYLIPNPNSPLEGGRFYNCYINRIDNLDLKEIVPLNLDEIVPKGMDVDAIEWYVQENYDETFKAAGGIILNKDETIGKVNVFAPSDGRIGITEEQHSRYQELEEVSKRVKAIISKKKEETEAFTKYQKEFLERQQKIDEELALLEEKIDLLTSIDENKEVEHGKER
ncbi:MAG: hypothetical protein IJL74_00035 [Bacilli bacterium]|nr:hypothetical protein [Bacilli bacterium]